MEKAFLRIQFVIHLLQIIIGFLASFFSLASHEQLEDNVKNHYWYFILIKFQGTLIPCLILSFFGFIIGLLFMYFNRINKSFLVNYKIREVISIILFSVLLNIYWMFY